MGLAAKEEFPAGDLPGLATYSWIDRANAERPTGDVVAARLRWSLTHEVVLTRWLLGRWSHRVTRLRPLCFDAYIASSA